MNAPAVTEKGDSGENEAATGKPSARSRTTTQENNDVDVCSRNMLLLFCLSNFFRLGRLATRNSDGECQMSTRKNKMRLKKVMSCCDPGTRNFGGGWGEQSVRPYVRGQSFSVQKRRSAHLFFPSGASTAIRQRPWREPNRPRKPPKMANIARKPEKKSVFVSRHKKKPERYEIVVMEGNVPFRLWSHW